MAFFMQLLFIILMVLVVGYVLFFPRKIDFFTIASFSMVIYLYPALFGEFTKEGVTTAVNPSTYICLCIWELVLFVLMLICDKYYFTFGHENAKPQQDRIIDDDVYEKYAILILCIIEGFLCLYSIQKYGGIVSSMKKVDMLAEANKITSYLKYIALYIFVYAFTNKGKMIVPLRIISIFFIGYTFLLGHRSFAVIGIIAIVEHYLYKNKKVILASEMKKHKIAAIVIIVSGLFFLFIKNIYAALFAGNIELVLSRLSNPNYYYDAIVSSEASGIIRNLQNTISHGLEYSILNYLLSFLTLIPFIGGKFARLLGYEAFSRKINLAFNSRFSDGFGIGSTFLGEAYAAGDYPWLIIICFFTGVFYNVLNKKTKKNSTGNGYVFWMITASYFVFYIYRNSMIYMFILMRANIYIFAIVELIKKVLKGFRKKAYYK